VIGSVIGSKQKLTGETSRKVKTVKRDSLMVLNEPYGGKVTPPSRVMWLASRRREERAEARQYMTFMTVGLPRRVLTRVCEELCTDRP
jgi:hypothetical protein